MNYTVVRYVIKPESVEENKRLLRKVFADLHDGAPEDFHLLSFALPDGMVLQIAAEEGESDALTSLESFQAYKSGMRDRALVMPEVFDAEVVGDYAVFAKRFQAK